MKRINQTNSKTNWSSRGRVRQRRESCSGVKSSMVHKRKEDRRREAIGFEIPVTRGAFDHRRKHRWHSVSPNEKNNAGRKVLWNTGYKCTNARKLESASKPTQGLVRPRETYRQKRKRVVLAATPRTARMGTSCVFGLYVCKCTARLSSHPTHPTHPVHGYKWLCSASMCASARNIIIPPPPPTPPTPCMGTSDPNEAKWFQFLVASDREVWSQVTACTVEVLLALSARVQSATQWTACNVTRVQSATQWTALVHTLHMNCFGTYFTQAQTWV